MQPSTPNFRSARRRGFTLVELLIAIALLLIVMLLVQQMFVNADRLYQAGQKRAEVYAQGRVALDVIEEDLQRVDISLDDIIMSSRFPRDVHRRGDVTSGYVRNRDNPGGYFETHDFIANTDVVNEDTENIVPILAFTTITQWPEVTRRGEVEETRWKSGKAQVIYYLRHRPSQQLPVGGDAFVPVSAYLVRRVLPFERDETTGLQVTAKIPRDEEISSSVLDVRIYAVNNAVASYMNQTGKVLELFPRLDSDYTGNAKLVMLDNDVIVPIQTSGGGGGGAGGSRSNADSIERAKPHEKRTYSFGSASGGHATNIETRGELPAAIAIELTICDNFGEILDSRDFDATVRTFRRIIPLTSSRVTSFIEEKTLTEKLGLYEASPAVKDDRPLR